MQYVLKISSFAGIVPGARHYRGRVEGEYPESCHGGTRHYGGKTTCFEGHELPDRVTWDVEADWSEERLERWAAARFEGPSPQQFDTKEEVIDRAVVQFLDGFTSQGTVVNDPARDGDELWYGYVHPEGFPYDESEDYSDGWGSCIARCSRGQPPGHDGNAQTP